MPTKIWLKPEQLELYIKQLERFRDLYSQLDQTLESDRQGFQFKAGAPNFQTTLSVSMQLQAKIRQAQSQTYGDVLFFNKELASKVQDLVSKSIWANLCVSRFRFADKGNWSQYWKRVKQNWRTVVSS